MAAYFPAFLDLTDRPCLVVGGGSVAERKVLSLRATGAAVRVISPALTPALQELAARFEIAWESRAYRPGDTEGAWLVIAATDDPAVNQVVADEAKSRQLLVNRVDSAAGSTFIVPAVVRRGPLTLAVSTGGRSPALAKRVRQELETIFPVDLPGHLAELVELRSLLRERLPAPAAREAAWRDLMEAGLLDLLRRGDVEAARNLAWAAAERAAADPPHPVTDVR